MTRINYYSYNKLIFIHNRGLNWNSKMEFVESDTSSTYETQSFVEWLQEQPNGQSLLATVPNTFIEDEFYLVDIENFFESRTDLEELIEIITGDAPDSDCTAEVLGEATNLYLLIHQRYLQTRAGQQAMESIIEGPGRVPCRRVLCEGAPMLPAGESSRIGVSPVRFWCPSCQELYSVGSGSSVTLDGAAFGPSFPLLYLMGVKGKTSDQILNCNLSPNSPRYYVPKIFGFKIKAGISSFKGRQMSKYLNK